MSLKVAVLAVTMGVASAFVPAGKAGKSLARASVQMSVNDYLGADVETGGVWDPLGLSKSEDSLYFWRAAEIKNGRVAQLAVLGNIVQSFYHLPDPVFNNPKPLGAFKQLAEQRPEALWQIFVFCGIMDVFIWPQDPSKDPGNVAGDNWTRSPDEESRNIGLLKELKNGRLAMIAFMGQIAQELVSGDGPIQLIQSGHLNPFGDGQGYF